MGRNTLIDGCWEISICCVCSERVKPVEGALALRLALVVRESGFSWSCDAVMVKGFRLTSMTGYSEGSEACLQQLQ